MLQKYDPRNENILIHVNGELVHRDRAKVSVFDSTVQGGDAVWEGLRVYSGRVLSLDRHLQRLRESAKALAFADIPSAASVKAAIMETLEANQMRDEAHVRLTLSRGEKITSGMDPRLNRKGACLIVLAEWKPPVYEQSGIRLITASTRRNAPQHLDSKIHHNNLLNNILAKIEANVAGADDAVMLDNAGFVSETNATNMFMLKGGKLLTPHADSCLPGITRETVLKLAAQLGMPCVERNLSITEFYNADQVFTTGTMGELTPVLDIDHRPIENGYGGDLLKQIQQAYDGYVQTHGEPLTF